MARRFSIFAILFTLTTTAPAFSQAVWYKCVVKGGSHTGRYTFKIEQPKCAVYWKEIDTQLKIKSCKLPIIEALKPSARDDLTIVWFNTKTGQFYDYLSGYLDRGWCEIIEKP